jgi:CRISPR-associated protein Cmr1
MKQLTCEIRFTTPAFLGNAEQDAQWRTPPFKALLRQWWRVWYAAEHGFNVDLNRMRHDEGMLFGHAWLDNDRDDHGHKIAARKSSIRIRLDGSTADPWGRGSMSGVGPLATGDSTSYARFGLIDRKGLPDRTAIKPSGAESVRTLHIAYPDTCEDIIRETVGLIDAFGAIGSRSRGGWGSIQVRGIGGADIADFSRFARNWNACLRDDWAMSLAKDDRPWMWHSTSTYGQWSEAMKFISMQRKKVRTDFAKDLRPALGFADNGRMPSPLRWKVIPYNGDRLRVRVFALPHRLPPGKSPREAELAQVWQRVCMVLDGSDEFVRA